MLRFRSAGSNPLADACRSFGVAASCANAKLELKRPKANDGVHIFQSTVVGVTAVAPEKLLGLPNTDIRPVVTDPAVCFAALQPGLKMLARSTKVLLLRCF